MNVGGLGSFANVASTLDSTARNNSAGATNAASSFGSSVSDAVEALDQSQKGAEREMARAVTGESPDLHKTIVALQSADLNFQFALQVRNKVIGAYEEIMRMQV